jgi:HlyD family secretion protein
MWIVTSLGRLPACLLLGIEIMKRSNITFLLVSVVPWLVACGGDESNFASVESGPFVSTITETGELQAVNYVTVTMPPFHWDYGRPKVTALAKEGIDVSTGEVIGQIETSGVTRALGQKQADLEIQQADLAKMLVEHETQLNSGQAEILSAEAQLRVAQIGIQQVSFESDSKQEVKKLELRIAELGLAKSQAKALAMKQTQNEELQIQHAKISQIVSAINLAEITLERFTLKAPAAGMIEYRMNRSTKKKIAVGDQVWQGWPLLGLPDLRTMKVLTNVNEMDVKKAFVGQPVLVRLDAFPKLKFDGHVTKISRVSRKMEDDSLIKVFDLEVSVHQSDPTLRPGMTVSCELIVAELDEALFVNPAGVHQEEDDFVVYLKEGSGVRRVPVSLGPRNTRGVVVRGGIQAGDLVALQPPAGEA